MPETEPFAVSGIPFDVSMSSGRRLHAFQRGSECMPAPPQPLQQWRRISACDGRQASSQVCARARDAEAGLVKKFAWRLDEAEQRLDAIPGIACQRSRLRDAEGEPSATLRRFSRRLEYLNLPNGVLGSAEERMQALRLATPSLRILSRSGMCSLWPRGQSGRRHG